MKSTDTLLNITLRRLLLLLCAFAALPQLGWAQGTAFTPNATAYSWMDKTMGNEQYYNFITTTATSGTLRLTADASITSFQTGKEQTDVKIDFNQALSMLSYRLLTATITGIAANAFADQTDIQTIILGSKNLNTSITSIGESAFARCTSLKSLVLYGNLGSIPIPASALPVGTTIYCTQWTDAAVAAARENGWVVARLLSSGEDSGLVLYSDETVSLNVENDPTSQISLSYIDDDAAPVPSEQITFVSANSNVATVSATGLITAVGSGTTTIQVKSDGVVKKTITVIVSGADSAVSLDQTKVTALATETVTLTLQVGDGVTINSVAWSTTSPILRLTPSETDGTYTCAVDSEGYGKGDVTATVSYTEDGEDKEATVFATITFNSTQYNLADGVRCISPTANHIVLQEISYAGRGNKNEPLARVLCYYPYFINGPEDAENWDPTEDLTKEGSGYSVSFKPYFDNTGDQQELISLHGYLRMYPQYGNPLRGDAGHGTSGGAVEPNNSIDLSVFDYRAPLLAANQTVFDLGVIAEGADIVSGQEYTVNIDRAAVANMVYFMKQTYNGLTTKQKAYFDPRFYIYICADINENCSDMNGDERNQIGCVVTKVSTYGTEGVYEGDAILSGFYEFCDKGSTAGVENTDHWNRPAQSYHIHMRAQTQKSRTILWRRILAYMPFDGYSKYYRIPGLTNLSDGTLVMTSDARKFHNHDVSNNVDVISRVSTNNGLTWSQPNIVAEGSFTDGENCATAVGYGDAAVGDLPTPGNVISVFLAGKGLNGNNGNGPKIGYSISTTSGRSWSEPKYISAQTFSYDNNASVVSNAIAVPGPGRMCTIQTGTHKGKVVFCAYQWVGGQSNQGPLSFLAFDEETGEWENLGYMGDRSDCTFGESQLVEIPQASGEPKFILTVRNESGTVAGKNVRRWYLLTPSVAAGQPYFPSFARATGSPVANAAIVNNGAAIQELTNGGNAFSYDAGTCNSNFYVYENTDGTTKQYFLIQAMPTSTAKQTGYSSGDAYRSQLVVKMADITELYEGGSLTGNTINWATTGINFSDPLDQLNNATADESDNNGYMNAGYSCVSYQTDGKIGIATEEFPFMYRTAPESTGDRHDVLLGGWYSSISLASLSKGTITELTTGRELPKPEIWPYNSTFKLDCTTAPQPEGKEAHAGVFVEQSTHSLPKVVFTVDPNEVQLKTTTKVDEDGNTVTTVNEKWRIDYDVYYRLHDTTTGYKLFDFMSTWYNPTFTENNKWVNYGENDPTHLLTNTSYYDTSTGKWTLEIELPLEQPKEGDNDINWSIIQEMLEKYTDFKKTNDQGEVDQNVILNSYTTTDSRSEYMHTGDSFVVRARVGVYPIDYNDFEKDENDDYVHATIVNDKAWTTERIDQGVINTTGYYAVSPSRKLIAKVLPQGVNAEVQMSSEFATAIFNNKTNLANDESTNLWMFGRPSFDLYPLHLAANIPDESPATFLGFSLSGKDAPVDKLGNLNPDNEYLIRNQKGPWIESKDGDNITYATASKDNNDYPTITEGKVLSDEDTPIFNTHVYPNPLELQFYVPSKETYEQTAAAADDYDLITFYAWFKALGGLYSNANLCYEEIDQQTLNTNKLNRAGAWTADLDWKAAREAELKAEDDPTKFLYDYYVANKPVATEEIEYPLYPINEATVYDQDTSIDLAWNTVENGESQQMGFDMGYIDFSFTPDPYGFKNSAVVTVWKYDADNKGYVPAVANRAYTYDESGAHYVDGGQGKLINIAGLDYKDDSRCQYTWVSKNSLPTEVHVPVSFSGCFNGTFAQEDQAKAAWMTHNNVAEGATQEATEATKMPIGMILLTVTDKPVFDYAGGNQYVDKFIESEQRLIQPSGSTVSIGADKTRSIVAEVEDDYTAPNAYYRVQYPIYYNTQTTNLAVQTGIEDIPTDSALDEDAPAEYYNLMGQRIANPAPGNIYIVRRGAKAQKILYR